MKRPKQDGDRRRSAAWMKTPIAAAAVLLGQVAYAAVAGYSGTPFTLGLVSVGAKGESRLEAENFDRGGEGVAYHDSDAGNAGRQYRQTEGVDIGLCNDEGGGYRVGWIGSGEWLQYSVRIAQAGKYTIVFRISSRPVGSPGGKLHLEDESGTDLTGKLDVPGTADTWADLRAVNVTLPAGAHVLRLVADVGGFNLNCMTFTLTQAAAAPGARPGAEGGKAADVPKVSDSELGTVIVETSPVSVGASPANRLGAFAEEISIGSPESAGQVSLADGGVYKVSGGEKIGGTADAFHFVHSAGSGDGQIVARIESVESAGSAGLMYRESTLADARFAAVLVTGDKGVSFVRRAAPGAQTYSAVVPLAKPPVWVKLVRSGNTFSGFHAHSRKVPAGADWKPIGSGKRVEMPENARVGLAVATGSAGTGTLSGVAVGADSAGTNERAALAVQPVATGQGKTPQPVEATGAGRSATFARLGGKAYEPYRRDAKVIESRAKAFDGDPATFYESPAGAPKDDRWTGIDLGSPQRVRKIEFLPRAGHESAMVGGVFQMAPDPLFKGGVADLYKVTSPPAAGTSTSVTVDAGRAYQYFRYSGGTGTCAIAEISVFSGADNSLGPLAKPDAGGTSQKPKPRQAPGSNAQQSPAGRAAQQPVLGNASPAGGAIGPARVIGDGRSGGSLSGSQMAETREETCDLSGNSLDWVQWGYEGNVYQRKAGVEERISDVELAEGYTLKCVNNSKAGFSWSDGTPARSATASKAGVSLVKAPGAVMMFKVRPMDTQPHTLTIYVGGSYTAMSLTASGPGGYYWDRRQGLGSEYFFFTYTVNFTMPDARDAVTVEVGYMSGAAGREGSVQLYAAQLR